MWVHSFCGYGCGWMPVRGFLCLFWRETHTKDLRARFLTTPEEDEKGQGPRAVNRRRQSTEVGERRRLEKGGYLTRSYDMWTLRPGRLTRQDESGFLATVCEFSSTRSWQTQKHRMLGKYPNFSLLALGANPSPWLFVLLFFHPLGCVYCDLCIWKAM